MEFKEYFDYISKNKSLPPKEMKNEDLITFISIDPSLRNTALVIGRIHDDEIYPYIWEIVETEKSKNKKIRASSDLVSRCSHINKEVLKIIEDVRPDVIFTETPSGSQSYHSAVSYAVSCYMLGTIIPPPIQVTPTELKKKTLGSKTASKKDIIEYVWKKYKDFELPMNGDYPTISKAEHICDAVCAAEAGIQTDQYKQIKNFLNK